MPKRVIYLFLAAAVAVVGYFLYNSYVQNARSNAVTSSACVDFGFDSDELSHVTLKMTNKCGFPVTLLYYFAEPTKGRECGSDDYICTEFLAEGDSASLRFGENGGDTLYHPQALRMLTCRGQISCLTSPNEMGHPDKMDVAAKAWFGSKVF